MIEQFEMEWEGRKYVLSPQGFFDAHTFLKHSRLAKDLGYLDLAEKITELALAAEPQNCFAIARLSSILRAKGEPRRALEVTARIPEGAQTHAVLTSRAAALCDLDRWPEAERIIRRAWAS